LMPKQFDALKIYFTDCTELLLCLKLILQVNIACKTLTAKYRYGICKCT
jgi:hypothetical protein